MAFNQLYLERVEATQENVTDKTLNPHDGLITVPGITLWMYNATSTGSNESAATVEGANYFLPAIGYMSLGDWIILNSNDPAHHILVVSANNGTNTISTTQVV